MREVRRPTCLSRCRPPPPSRRVVAERKIWTRFLCQVRAAISQLPLRVPILNMLIIEPSKTARGSCVVSNSRPCARGKQSDVRKSSVGDFRSETDMSIKVPPPPPSPLISCISTSNKLKSIGSVGWNQWFRAHRPTRHARCRREPPNPDCRGE